MDCSQIEDEAQYLLMVKQYSYLVNHTFLLIEEDIKAGVNPQELVNALPKLISLVNVVGFFRGQDGVFSELQNLRTNSTSLLRKNEDEFEKRLLEIIEYVNTDPVAAKYYKTKLLEYYLINRGVVFGLKTIID
jgi:predicted ATP-binding protein involved in virulence